MKKIISLLYYTFFVLTGAVLLPLSLVIWVFTILFDKRLYILHLYAQWWESFLFFIIPKWNITIIGKEKINNSKAVVFVSNHQSEFDIIVISRLYAHFKWVSKSEVFKSPIIGWNMRLNKYIELKRGDRKSIIKMIKDSVRVLKNGSSIFIFPEGTRSKTGALRNFSSGAFVIAKRAKVDIQPIVINGTKNIMEKGSWVINFSANTATVHVLDKIPYYEIKDMDSGDIAKMVKERIATQLEKQILSQEN